LLNAVKLYSLREPFLKRSPDRTPPLLSGEMVAGCGIRSRPRGGGVWGGICAGFGFLFVAKFWRTYEFKSVSPYNSNNKKWRVQIGIVLDPPSHSRTNPQGFSTLRVAHSFANTIL